MIFPQGVSLVLLAFLAARLVASASAAAGETRSWTGLGANEYWLTPGNWVNNSPPQAGDKIEFPAQQFVILSSNNFSSGTLFESLRTFSLCQIRGNAIALAGGIHSATATIIESPITLAGSQTFMADIGSLDIRNVAIGPHTLTLDGGGFHYLEGQMTGSGNVIKWATGAWVISGTNGTTGTNFVFSDELRVLGAISDGTVVAGPGTQVTGTGYIDRLQARGLVSAGEDRDGVLTVGSEMALSATATTEFEIRPRDEIFVCNSIAITNPASAVNLGNAVLRVIVSSAPPPIGSAFRLIDRAGSSPFTNFFAGLPEGSVFTVTSYYGSNCTFQISYAGGTGNDVILTRPPPTLVAMSSGNPFQFRILGQPDTRYVIEAATNLLNPDWLPIATNVADSFGILNLMDAGTTLHSQRFYRAR